MRRARARWRRTRQTDGVKEIYNTFGIIRGTEFPDEMVIMGAHRDAWGPGAADNVSGTVSVLEAARAVLEQGGRPPPARTLVFATWDAEEWGLIGSTEYVEDDSARLTRGGVAYLNQDVSALGPQFGGGGSPSLRADAARRGARRSRPDRARGACTSVWRRRAAVADSVEPAMGDPGRRIGLRRASTTTWGFRTRTGDSAGRTASTTRSTTTSRG